MNYRKNNKLIILCTASFLIMCLFFTSTLNLDKKITSMLPSSDPLVADFNYIINNIPAVETLYIDIENLQADNKTIEQAADDFFNEINSSVHFSGIVYKFSHDVFLNLLNLVHENRSSLLDKNDLSVIESRLTPERIQEQLIHIKKNLLIPSGIFTADSLISDPLQIDELILSKLNAFKKETLGVKIMGSRIYSADGKHLLMLAAPNFSALDTDKSIEMFKFLNKMKIKISEKYNNKIHIRFSGSHAATLDNSQTIQQDVKLAAAASTLCFLVIGILFFRRMAHAILIFLPTGVSLLFASALISISTKEVSAIALGCGTVLIGITVDFGVHILFHLDHSQDQKPEAVIKSLMLPLLAASGTTITAFCSLLFSSLPGQRQMGLFSIIGIFGSAVFAIFLLKFFIPKLKTKQKEPIVSLVGICDKLMDFRRNHIGFIVVTGIALVIISAFGIKNFKFEGDISKLNHLQPTTKSDMDNFLETWGGFSPTIVLVKDNTLEAALKKNDALFELLNELQKNEMIDQVASLSEILPSEKKREDNYIEFKKFMPEDRVKNIEQLFKEASVLVGFKSDTFSPFISSLNRDRSFFTINDFKNTALKTLIDSKVVFKGNDVLIITTMNIKDKSKTSEIIEIIKSEIDGSMLLDNKYFIKTITSHVVREFKQLSFFTAIAMILIIFLSFRNLKIVMITICPVFLSAFITAGILGLTHTPINLISMIFIIFVFGVGDDFSIFLMNHELCNTEKESNITAGAVIICALTTLSSFACLALAKHAALFSIGIAGLTGMISNLVLSLMLIPSLSQKFLNQNDKRAFFGK